MCFYLGKDAKVEFGSGFCSLFAFLPNRKLLCSVVLLLGFFRERLTTCGDVWVGFGFHPSHRIPNESTGDAYIHTCIHAHTPTAKRALPLSELTHPFRDCSSFFEFDVLRFFFSYPVRPGTWKILV